MKLSLLAGMLALGLLAASQGAQAGDDIIVNGLPCNALCRSWMGIKDPHSAEPSQDIKQEAAPSAETDTAPPHKAKKAHKTLLARHEEEDERPPSAHVKRRKDHVARAAPDRLAERPPAAKERRFWESDDFSKEIADRISHAPPAGAAPAKATPEAGPAKASADAPATSAPTPVPSPSPIVVAAPTPSPSHQEETAPVAVMKPAEAAKTEPTPSAAVESPAAAVSETPAPSPSVAAAPAVSPTEPSDGAAVGALKRPAQAADVETAPPSPSPVASPAASPSETPVASAPAKIGEAETPEPSPIASAAPVMTEPTNDSAQQGEGSGKIPNSTPVPAADVAVNDPAASPPIAAPQPAETHAAAEPDPSKAQGQVLVVLAKPEVKGVTDLQDQSIVIAGVYSVSNERMRESFAAEGARGLSFKQGDAGDVELLKSGKVAAAIIAVAEPEIAAAFHEIPGFHLLLVQVPQAGKP